MLVLLEVRGYFSSKEHHTVSVDTSNAGELMITFDITFPNAPCPAIHPDIMDFSGLRNENAKVTFEKVRLDRQGKTIGRDSTVIPPLGNEFFSTECFSCYGAKSADECCNTCDSLVEAFKDAGMDFDKILPIAPQCRQRYYVSQVEKFAGEGCRIRGSIAANKFPGNLHFAAGVAVEKSSYHGHIVEGLERIPNFNFSHRINKLYFGDHDPSIRCPLEGEEKSVSDNSFLFSYHLRLVNSILVKKGKQSLNAYEYSTTQNTSKSESTESLTGVFFHYEISPMLMERRIENQISFASLLINICSIVGGIFALSSIIDAILFKVELKLAQKRSLGKAM